MKDIWKWFLVFVAFYIIMLWSPFGSYFDESEVVVKVYFPELFFFFLQIISQVAQYHLINHLDYVEMQVFTYIIFPCIFASVF